MTFSSGKRFEQSCESREILIVRANYEELHRKIIERRKHKPEDIAIELRIPIATVYGHLRERV